MKTLAVVTFLLAAIFCSADMRWVTVTWIWTNNYQIGTTSQVIVTRDCDEHGTQTAGYDPQYHTRLFFPRSGKSCEIVAIN